MGLNAADFVRKTRHLSDNGEDRRIGERWERNFCLLGADHHKMFTPHQINRTVVATATARIDDEWRQLLLPDVTIWTAPGEHHEIKHKDATGMGCYGLEKYRLDALVRFRRETQQPVLYTIHDWRKAGASSSHADMPNRIEDWLTVDVLVLEAYVIEHHKITWPFPTWVNGQKDVRDGYYWPIELWRPLAEWWSPALFELPEE